MKSSSKTLESCGFNTNFLYVNVGSNEEGQQSMVSIENKEIEFFSLQRIEEEQLLRTVVEDFVTNG